MLNKYKRRNTQITKMMKNEIQEEKEIKRKQKKKKRKRIRAHNEDMGKKCMRNNNEIKTKKLKNMKGKKEDKANRKMTTNRRK